ncbi:hypothetical protein [Hydrogenimonas sp.]
MFFLLLFPPLFANSIEDIDVKIWRRIIYDIKLPEYKVYTADIRLKEILCQIPGIELVTDCKEATLIIDTKESRVADAVCQSIPRLTNDYRTLLKHRNEIGAFFWMKGRPTIVISGPRLERFGLKVELELEEFIEEID